MAWRIVTTVTTIVDTMTAMKARNRLMVARSTKNRLEATIRATSTDGLRRSSGGRGLTSSPAQRQALGDHRDAEQDRVQANEDHEDGDGRAGPRPARPSPSSWSSLAWTRSC